MITNFNECRAEFTLEPQTVEEYEFNRDYVAGESDGDSWDKAGYNDLNVS